MVPHQSLPLPWRLPSGPSWPNVAASIRRFLTRALVPAAALHETRALVGVLSLSDPTTAPPDPFSSPASFADEWPLSGHPF